MKNLLIFSVVLAMLVVFSGVANAADTIAVFMSCVGTSCGQISFPVNNINEKQVAIGTTGLDQTYLQLKPRIFKGHLVANVSGLPDGPFSITELFFCGNVVKTTATGPVLTPAQIDFTNFATALSDILFGSTHQNQAVTLDLIGTGDLWQPPPSITGTDVGPDIIRATASGEYFGTPRTLSKIVVAGTIAGGFSDDELLPSASTFLFNAGFITTLVAAPTSVIAATCTTGATCSSAGVVECAP
jgi:hypothetical protein